MLCCICYFVIIIIKTNKESKQNCPMPNVPMNCPVLAVTTKFVVSNPPARLIKPYPFG